MYKKNILAAVITGVMAAPALADLSFDANLELDTTMVDTDLKSAEYNQGGRVEINAFAKRELDQYFVAAKGTVKLGTEGETAVDDAYIQLGTDTWDVQAGRFEATDLFPKGKDTLIEHANGEVYEANMGRGRFGNSGGQFAFHLNPADNLKFELATMFGDVNNDDEEDKDAFTGLRPAVMWSSDVVNVTVGYEQVKYDQENAAGQKTGEVDKSGLAATANFKLAGADVNVNAAQMKDNNTDDKVTTYGTNLVYGAFGAGFIYSKSDKDAANVLDTSVKTTYLAYTMPLFGIESASATLAGSYSSADDVAENDNDKTTAVRLRLNYTF